MERIKIVRLDDVKIIEISVEAKLIDICGMFGITHSSVPGTKVKIQVEIPIVYNLIIDEKEFKEVGVLKGIIESENYSDD